MAHKKTAYDRVADLPEVARYRDRFGDGWKSVRWDPDKEEIWFCYVGRTLASKGGHRSLRDCMEYLADTYNSPEDQLTWTKTGAHYAACMGIGIPTALKLSVTDLAQAAMILPRKLPGGECREANCCDRR